MYGMYKHVRTDWTDTHAIFYFRYYEEDWGYMGMRDYPTYERTDRFKIDVVPFGVSGRADNTDAGIVCNSFRTKEFDTNMANLIAYNVKHGCKYETLRAELKNRELIAKEA